MDTLFAAEPVAPNDRTRHPGSFVRATLLKPRGLSVVDAARLVGISRPAFSNYLNGRVGTTSQMAARIEAAFGFPAQKLLDMQAAFEAATTSSAVVSPVVTPYAVPFLGIKARDIEQWAQRNIPARSRLAVLIRTLVHSTGREITSVDFPGNDDAERPGWDGHLEAVEGTPWIPAGTSGWEFGTNEDPKSKAEGDYTKSLKAVTKAARAAMTFVFVTPRSWPGKNDWATLKRSKREWLDVRAYDSSDLEQWIEQSIAAQVWLAHEVGRTTRGVRTLPECWDDWANVAEPPLPSFLFDHAVEGAKKSLVAHLAAEPGEPIVLMADSSGEALAFLARFFESVDDSKVAALRDRVLVFDEPGTAKELAQGTPKFVAVVHSRAVERDLSTLARHVKCIVVYPRNAANVEPHVVLEPLNSEHFRVALEAAGYSRDAIAQFDLESGRSLTVLRRRLAKTPAVRLPEWVMDAQAPASLVPFLLVGAWNATSLADQTVLILLAGDESYESLERRCQQLTQLYDSPMWSVGQYRGVASKIDLLFSIASNVVRLDLDRFFQVAQIVLGEDDPKLDLADDQQWAAAIHGKTREFSGTLRKSIAETLVLLSVHGHHLFFGRLGFDCELAAQSLVRNLLTPLKARLLEANDRDLTAYAEAAPEEFLSIIESDLRQPLPETYALLRPAGTGFFGGCPRTGLLWALEGLSWSSATMPRAALILAQLSQIEINDNWVNRPINSLEAIFRAWMPQTAATPGDRLKVMGHLATRFSKVAWKVCIAQLNAGPRTGTYSHKPKWRNDGHGHGEPYPTRGPVAAFLRDMVEMALHWKHPYTAEMLSDLVSCVQGLSPEARDRVWSIIEGWAAVAPDADKAIVREQIRKRLLSRWAKRQSSDDEYAALIAPAKRARAALEPSDLLQKHEWMFRSNWVEYSDDDLADDGRDYAKREARVASVRTDALRDIDGALGSTGVVDLADLGDAHYTIGYLYAGRVLSKDAIAGAIRAALERESPGKANARRLLVSGLINGLSDVHDRQVLLDRLACELHERNFLQVLLAAPFQSETWRRVDSLSCEAKSAYWANVSPDGFRSVEGDAVEGIERLVAAKRPRAAFHSALFCLEKLDPEVLFRLMNAIAKDSNEPEGHFQLQQYYIDEAFERINQSTEITLDQKAGLEYLYVDALAKPDVNGGRYGIPNLTKYVDLHPELFVQAVVYAYRRNDGESDPPEFAVPAELSSRFAEQGYKLLSGLETVPGRDEQGQLRVERLRAWVDAVRSGCLDLGRLEIGDLKIGELLAHGSPGIDCVWPCESVREVLEEVHSESMLDGANVGKFNARGVHSRGEGGAQERELANQYRAWADALQYTHPYVSSRLLMRLAKTYEQDARREDTNAVVRRRLH